ncbi:MAG: hypothetical protein QM734_06865 [Cyclobacteriaceae bacterium]
MEKIDKFFKEKLENHTTTPPEGAWPKVESNLSKKNNVIAWRIAAAILLAGALLGIILWEQQNTETIKIAKAPSKGMNKKTPPVTTEKKSEESKPIRTEVKSKIPVVEKKQIQPAENEPAPKIKLMETETELTQQYTIKLPTDNTIEEKQKEQATVTTEIASTKQKPIKLEFTLEDVPSGETVATTNEVKNSGFKKVLNMARDMKQGEGWVTNLREKKNEIFAHNFITGKTKNQ